jgi:hypothetical protein
MWMAERCTPGIVEHVPFGAERLEPGGEQRLRGALGLVGRLHGLDVDLDHAGDLIDAQRPDIVACHKPPKFEADGARFLIERIGGKKMCDQRDFAPVEKPDNSQAAGIASVARGLEFSRSGNENRLRFLTSFFVPLCASCRGVFDNPLVDRRRNPRNSLLR